MLILKGILKKIQVRFFVVGHTHDQIDQKFSQFYVRLNKSKAFV
jgi:hypothetical protein